MGHCKLHPTSTSNVGKWGRRLKNWKSFWLEVRWSQWPSLALIFDSMNKQWEYLECTGKQGNLTSRCSVWFPIIFTAGYPCWSGSTVNWMVLRTQGWARNDHISLGSLWRSITHCNWGTRKVSAKLAARDLCWQLLCLERLVEMGKGFFWAWGKKVNGTSGKAVRNLFCCWCLLCLWLQYMLQFIMMHLRLSKLHSYTIIKQRSLHGDDF